jgi:hypothetical protein
MAEVVSERVEEESLLRLKASNPAMVGAPMRK